MRKTVKQAIEEFEDSGVSLIWDGDTGKISIDEEEIDFSLELGHMEALAKVFAEWQEYMHPKPNILDIGPNPFGNRPEGARTFVVPVAEVLPAGTVTTPVLKDGIHPIEGVPFQRPASRYALVTEEK